jgi:hypothetical protein
VRGDSAAPHQTRPVGQHHRLQPIPQAQLRQDPAHVLLRSVRGTAALTAIRHDGLVVGTVVLPILLGTAALVVLLAGVARAGLGGWWLPIAGAVSVVAEQVTSDSANAALMAAVFLPMAVALGAVGTRLLSGSAQRRDAPVPVAA